MKPENFILMETDTDSIYLALKYENFEDNIDPEKFDLYERLKHDFFITKKCKYGKRQPNRYQIECEGQYMLALCSKSYCIYDEENNAVKYSLKGVQKRQLYTHTNNEKSNIEGDDEYNPSKNVYELYQTALKTNAAQKVRLLLTGELNANISKL